MASESLPNSVIQTISNTVQDDITRLATQSEDLNMGTYKIVSLGTPSASTDAATKGYVDGLLTDNATITYVNSVLADGTYTPTGTSISNIAAFVSTSAIYSRVNNTVTVHAYFDITASSSNTFSFKINIPIDRDTNFAAATDAIGTGSRNNDPEWCAVDAVVGEKTVRIYGYANSTTADIFVSFAYRLV